MSRQSIVDTRLLAALVAVGCLAACTAIPTPYGAILRHFCSCATYLLSDHAAHAVPHDTVYLIACHVELASFHNYTHFA